MAIQNYLDRLKQMDQLIRLRSTGTPKKFACKLGISERMLYEYLNVMKSEGALIGYSSLIESYYYEKEGNFIIGYQEKFEV